MHVFVVDGKVSSEWVMFYSSKMGRGVVKLNQFFLSIKDGRTKHERS